MQLPRYEKEDHCSDSLESCPTSKTSAVPFCPHIAEKGDKLSCNPRNVERNLSETKLWAPDMEHLIVCEKEGVLIPSNPIKKEGSRFFFDKKPVRKFHQNGGLCRPIGRAPLGRKQGARIPSGRGAGDQNGFATDILYGVAKGKEVEMSRGWTKFRYCFSSLSASRALEHEYFFVRGGVSLERRVGVIQRFGGLRRGQVRPGKK